MISDRKLSFYVNAGNFHRRVKKDLKKSIIRAKRTILKRDLRKEIVE